MAIWSQWNVLCEVSLSCGEGSWITAAFTRQPGSSSEVPPSSLWASIWKAKVPPKIHLNFWKLGRDICPRMLTSPWNTSVHHMWSAIRHVLSLWRVHCPYPLWLSFCPVCEAIIPSWLFPPSILGHPILRLLSPRTSLKCLWPYAGVYGIAKILCCGMGNATHQISWSLALCHGGRCLWSITLICLVTRV